jgi:hypothetical protein
MGFPYIFRGALDVRATTINQEMKIAAAMSLAELARQPVPEEVYKAYAGRKMIFGPDYIIPVPFDPRLITTVPLAVAKAAIDSGVAKITEFDAKNYKKELESRMNPTSHYINLLFEKIQASDPQRIVFAEGEEEDKGANPFGEGVDEDLEREYDKRSENRNTPEVPEGGWKGAGRPKEGIKYNTEQHPRGYDPIGKVAWKNARNESVDVIKKYGLTKLAKTSSIILSEQSSLLDEGNIIGEEI